MSRRVYSKMYLVFDVRQSNYEDLWLQARRYEVWMWVLSREQRVYEGGTVIVLFLEVGSGRRQRRVGTSTKVLGLRYQVRKDFWTDGACYLVATIIWVRKYDGWLHAMEDWVYLMIYSGRHLKSASLLNSQLCPFRSNWHLYCEKEIFRNPQLTSDFRLIQMQINFIPLLHEVF